jgi:hypothetical protein
MFPTFSAKGILKTSKANNVTQYSPITIWNFQVILNWRWEARNLDDLDSASAVLYLQALMPGCWQACFYCIGMSSLSHVQTYRAFFLDSVFFNMLFFSMHFKFCSFSARNWNS